MLSRVAFHVRTVIVLAVLVIGLVIAGTWGWRQMTRPFPAKAQAAVCEDTDLKTGEKVYPAQVVVSVLNASNREGLASRTISALEDAGFVAGKSGNAPGKITVKRSEIWAGDPTNPAVRLVATWLHKPKVVKRATNEPGVVVLVGKDFTQVSGGRRFAVARTDTSVCSPPLTSP